jgi:FtsP/CotA-like multicopper oxidase with cupredoxin domain
MVQWKRERRMIPPGGRARYTFTPRPAGFRWYHTHIFAGKDLHKGQYTGEHGFLLIEPRDNPARYDQEFFLALHDWDGQMLSSGDGAMDPVYEVSTINGRVLGFGEPLRVKSGEQVLLHILNSSPSEVHWIALAAAISSKSSLSMATQSRNRKLCRCFAWRLLNVSARWWR